MITSFIWMTFIVALISRLITGKEKNHHVVIREQAGDNFITKIYPIFLERHRFMVAT
jgi:hypothetical protein